LSVLGFNNAGTAEIIKDETRGCQNTNELVKYMNSIITNEINFNPVKENAYMCMQKTLGGNNLVKN
jgi:hypothetical protein